MENSWGDDSGQKGYIIMTNEWFNEYSFRLVVDKKYVPQNILKAAATVMIDVSNDLLASLFIPLAFGLAVSDVHIDIESANLKSGGDIAADATSDINVKGEASTGKLPVAIALSIGVSDTHVKVTGDSVLNAGGNVDLNADLKLQTEASSKKGDMEGTSGGFIAVEIGVTDSYVKVTDNTNITAGKDVSLNSNGSITGVATATSAGDGEAEDSVGGQTDKIKGLLTSVRDTLMVSPMPLSSRAPMPMADLILPWSALPASVTPRWTGKMVPLSSIAL